MQNPNLNTIGKTDDDKLVIPSGTALRRALRTIDRKTKKANRPAARVLLAYERGTTPSAPELFAAAQAAKLSR